MREFKHIWIELYSENIYFIQCTNEQYVKMMERVFKTIVKPTTASGKFCVINNNNDDAGVIWVKNDINYGLIAHECFHAVCWILSFRGFWLTDSSEEAYSYLLEYLFKQVCKFNLKIKG